MHHSHQLEKQTHQEFLPFEFVGFDTKTYLSDFLQAVITLIAYGLGILLLLFLQNLFDAKSSSVFKFLNKYPLLWGLYVPVSIIFMFGIGYFMHLPKKLVFLLPYSIRKFFIKVSRQHRIGIDKENEELLFFNEMKQFVLPLKSIQQIKYSFNYVIDDDSKYKDVCNLKVILEFKTENKIRKKTVNSKLRKIHFYKWEEFLEKLPNTIRVQTFIP